MSELKGLPEGKVVRVGKWGILGCWYCVPLDLAEDEIVKQLQPALAIPVSDPALIKDRFYGGFLCDREERRHVFFNAGQYTYTHPEDNVPVSPERRAEAWKELLEANPGQLLGDGPFTGDAPVLNLKEIKK